MNVMKEYIFFYHNLPRAVDRIDENDNSSIKILREIEARTNEICAQSNETSQDITIVSITKMKRQYYQQKI